MKYFYFPLNSGIFFRLLKTSSKDFMPLKFCSKSTPHGKKTPTYYLFHSQFMVKQFTVDVLLTFPAVSLPHVRASSWTFGAFGERINMSKTDDVVTTMHVV